MATLVTHDPRHLDGEPFEVAGIAGDQLLDSLRFAFDRLEDFKWAARGAWLSSEHYRTGEMPDGEAFYETAQGKKLLTMADDLNYIIGKTAGLRLAAAWNPRVRVT